MTYGLRLRPALAALFTTEVALLLTIVAVTGTLAPLGIA